VTDSAQTPAMDFADAAAVQEAYLIATAVSDAHPDGFITVDKDGIIDFANRRAARICGVAQDDLRGRPLRTALPFQNPAGQEWWEIADPWRSLHITTGFREASLILPNGHVVLVTGRYLRQPDGSILAVILGLRDAAGRMRAERQMADMITSVAHELRSPIASITGFTGSLLRHWERFSDTEKQVILHTIQHDGGRVMRLITDLLEVSRIDSGNLILAPRPVEVASLLRGQVDRCVARGEPETRFEVSIEEGLAPLFVDADRVEQILTNLLDNALRHGSGRVFIQAQADTIEGAPAVRIVISDEGSGIPPEDRELVFSRHWQGGAKSGAGIGLYLVRGYVQAHGGQIELGDRDGGGAAISVRLPTEPPRHSTASDSGG